MTKHLTRSRDRKQVVRKFSETKAKLKTQASQAPSKHQLQNSIRELPWYNVFTKTDPMYNSYMANEWGYEKRGDKELFEKMSLEGAQSGLSWRTILNKREAYRKAFRDFDIHAVSKMTHKDVDTMINSDLSGNDSVVKHRGKLESVIHNAKILETMNERLDGYTTFTDYLWGFVKNKPILNAWKAHNNMPSKTEESEAMSKALKKCGFKFVGPTTCYSLMQSCGFVIDHPFETDEWRDSLKRLQKRRGGFQDRR